VSQVWFARVRSLSGPGSRMTPVSREGWMVVAGFVIAMLVGALLFAALMTAGSVVLGVALFALVAILAGGGFIWAAIAHGDNQRTAADYRRMGKGGST
jgi:hypothetical protein